MVAAFGMEDDRVIHDFDVPKRIQRDDDGSPFDAQDEGFRFSFSEKTDDPVQLKAQIVISDRLDDESKGAHVIAMDCAMGEIGDKDDHQRQVALTEFAGDLHPIDPRHVDIEEDDVVGIVDFIQKLQRLGKKGDVKMAAPFLFLIFFQAGSDMVQARAFFIDNGDFQPVHDFILYHLRATESIRFSLFLVETEKMRRKGFRRLSFAKSRSRNPPPLPDKSPKHTEKRHFGE